jgi:hypothetical protein
MQFPELVTLPAHPGGHHHLGGRNKQTYFGMRTHSPSSPPCFDFYVIQRKLLFDKLTSGQMFMLHENLHIQTEVKTLNPATLLPVDSGTLEHDCLEVMDEVFSSWPDLTDQPISHLGIGCFTDGRQQLCLEWHMFCRICSSDSGYCH